MCTGADLQCMFCVFSLCKCASEQQAEWENVLCTPCIIDHQRIQECGCAFYVENISGQIWITFNQRTVIVINHQEISSFVRVCMRATCFTYTTSRRFQLNCTWLCFQIEAFRASLLCSSFHAALRTSTFGCSIGIWCFPNRAYEQTECLLFGLSAAQLVNLLGFSHDDSNSCVTTP